MNKGKSIIKNKIFSALLISGIFLLSDYLFIKNNAYSKDEIDNLSDVNFKSEYILGEGDQLLINFPGLELFTDRYSINTDGNLILPEIYEIHVRGKTIPEVTKALNKKYKEYINNPNIHISISRYKPVNVFMKGEVKTPGLYKLQYYRAEDNVSTINSATQTFTGNYPGLDLSVRNPDINFISPRLFDALKISNGLTHYADLSKIQIIRKNSISQGGGKITTSINFLTLLNDGDQTNNIRIYDGDIIYVPKSEKLIKDQILAINKTNISPDTMTIFVTGNVRNPGQVILGRGSTLTQAVYAAGGEEYFTGTVKHLRFNNSGNTEKNTYNFENLKNNNINKNPTLLNGDIIIVNENILGKLTSTISEVTSPILNSFAIYSLISD